jgi:sulfite reductase (NADPH) hemoprotein beta-component
MDAITALADAYSFGRLVVTHRQNMVFSDVETRKLPELHAALAAVGLATPNFDKLTDVIACPGLDYCNLANARSINIAEAIVERFADVDSFFDLGDITVNISGCINACGHHHVGNIGILGIDKQGVEHYQLMLGGNHTQDASLGKILGRALREDEVVDALERVLETYVAVRDEGEPFIQTYRRVGATPFEEAVYGDHQGSVSRHGPVSVGAGPDVATAAE